jgi:hypothetical protein
MASTYLTTSRSTPTNQFKWTFSGWFKLSDISNANGGGNQVILSDYTDASNRGNIYLESNDDLVVADRVSNTNILNYTTTRKFRDPNAWYHIVVSHDRTLATPETKIYVNGVEETSFSTSTNPSQNETSYFNKSGQDSLIGKYGGGAEYYDGLMTHVHWIDGTVYDASAFGQTDATTGIWKPKVSPSVTYGTNGFFLKFENSANMDLDSSPNNLTFSTSGTLTQTVDTPSNVFAVLNPLTKTNASMIFTNGNTTCTATGNWIGNMATLGATKGKWYAEAKITDPLNFSIGFAKFGGTFQNNLNTVNSGYLGIGNDSWGFWGNGASADLYHNSTNTSYGSLTSENDIIMLAMDLDNGNLYWGKNGTWFNSSNPATSTSPAFSGINIDEYITFGTGVENGSVQWNFGNGYFGTTAVSSATTDESGLGIFEYTVPSGYYALCTKNINEQEYD